MTTRVDVIELEELEELLRQGSIPQTVLGFLSESMTLKVYANCAAIGDLLDLLASHRRAIVLSRFTRQADALGPFGDIVELERLSRSVPEEYRDSYIFGYVQGMIDIRHTCEGG